MDTITIHITERQSDYLEAEKARLGIVPAEIVRRALDFYIDHFPIQVRLRDKEQQLSLLDESA